MSPNYTCPDHLISSCIFLLSLLLPSAITTCSFCHYMCTPQGQELFGLGLFYLLHHFQEWALYCDPRRDPRTKGKNSKSMLKQHVADVCRTASFLGESRASFHFPICFSKCLCGRSQDFSLMSHRLAKDAGI